MSQLTIRGFDAELERRIRDLAKREGLSMNQAALRLLRKGAGLTAEDSARDEGRIGSSLDHFFGTWSDKDLREFEDSVRDLEQIDDSLWQ